jgi:hypothetical protein
MPTIYTAHYQILNCTMGEEPSQTIIEGCTPDVKCERPHHVYNFFIFQLIVFIFMLVSGFYFFKRKKDLNDAKEQRYSNSLKNKLNLIKSSLELMV